MPDLLLVINDAGAIECVTQAAAAAFGYSPAELCGQPPQLILDMPDPRSLTSPQPSWVSATPHPILQGIHRDGRRFPLRLTQDPIQGGQTHYVLLLRDASEPVAVEHVFLKHDQLYELATRHGRISVWEVDYRTNHFEYSPVLAYMLGLSEEQVPKTVASWKQHFHPDDWHLLERQSERLVHREIPEINVEMRMLHADGSIHWGLVRARAFFDDEGRPIKALGTTIDITERKRAEEERDLFFTLSLDPLCIADTTGYFRRVNPAFCQTLGYTAEELTTRPFLDFVLEEDQQKTVIAMAVLKQGGDVIAFENRYRCKDGSFRWLSWMCPAPASNLMYAVAHDVTAAKEFQVKLEKATQEAENANRAKSEFLSRMSHELRTPLNAILGFGQLLQREPLSPRQRQQIDLIVKGGRHLLALINEVLDITRIEVGRLDLSPEPIELADLIDEIVSLTQPMADQLGVQVKIDQASVQNGCVQADKQRLKQVLLNLVSNAIKYNVKNGRVTIHCEPAPMDRLCIHVEDTGRGIAPDMHARLFTPFDRLGAETTGIEGSGLGLVLSRRLVEIMGGGLTFTSKPEVGTRFSVELARCKGVRGKAGRFAPASPADDCRSRPRADAALYRGQPGQRPAHRSGPRISARHPPGDGYARRLGAGTGPATSPRLDPPGRTPARHQGGRPDGRTSRRCETKGRAGRRHQRRRHRASDPALVQCRRQGVSHEADRRGAIPARGGSLPGRCVITVPSPLPVLRERGGGEGRTFNRC